MTNRISLLALLAMLSASTAASGQLRVTEADILRAPKSYVGQKLRIVDIYCVDPGKGGFLCLKEAQGQILMVDGLVMGPSTSSTMAELLSGGCKGTANLGNARCLMDAEFELTAAAREMVDGPSGSIQRVTLVTGTLEFRQKGKR
jgi:hypothetical protein